MSDVLTIPPAPPEHPIVDILDFEALLREGVRQLERLTDGQWTDFNAHDPGITILETVCYALTDLGYRSFHHMPDLLADRGGDARAGLFAPAEILTGRAVTFDDLRKVALDITGVRNVWIEPADRHGIPLRYVDKHLVIEMPDAVPPPVGSQRVNLAGLHRVLIEQDRGADALGSVADQLSGHRNLCEDFDAIAVCQIRNIAIEAKVELTAAAHVGSVESGIHARLAAYLSPPVPRIALADAIDRGDRFESLFEGPAVGRGIVDPAWLAATRCRTALHASDVIREIADVPGVRTVRSVSLRDTSSGKVQRWSLALGRDEVPAYDRENSHIGLFQGAVQVKPLTPLAPAGSAAPRAPALAPLVRATPDLRAPPGRDRDVGAYFPLRDELPAAYGIARGTLPASAPETRKAQANQLRGYLAILDQLLANQFSQLAHARDLLSGEGDPLVSYRAELAPDTDGEPDLPSLHAQGLRERLQAIVEKRGSETAVARRNRFFDHLLARFGEALPDALALLTPHPLAELETIPEALLRNKQDFLRSLPELGGARGTGFDYRNPLRAGHVPLAERVRFRLALPDEAESRFFVVEHILLRPVAEDYAVDLLPFLEAAETPDPFSLQLSFVFPSKLKDYSLLVEKAAREETPAHLALAIKWLDPQQMAIFTAIQGDWLTALRLYRSDSNRPALAFAFRAARDRMIEQLGLGETYPLRNPTLRDVAPVAAYWSPAEIVIETSQESVLYRLRTENWAGPEVRGTGGAISLMTPDIREDASYTLHARKPASRHGLGLTERSADLLPTIKVKVGPAPRVEVIPSPVIAYKTAASLTMTHTNASASYQAFLRPISDREYHHGAASESGLLRVEPLGEAAVQIRAPSLPADGTLPEGFTSTGEPGAGNGGAITLRLGELAEDQLVLVQARKPRAPEGSEEGTSSIWLSHPAIVLVRPDPDRSLTLRLIPQENGRILRVTGGQPGVFYYLRPLSDGPELEQPAYFHQRDRRDPSRNKGVGELQVEVDFVIAPTLPPALRELDPATTPPLAPELEAGTLTEGTPVAVRAVKAQTRLGTELKQNATITASPPA